MTDDREGWGEDETGTHPEKYALAKEELIELGTETGEHHGDD